MIERQELSIEAPALNNDVIWGHFQELLDEFENYQSTARCIIEIPGWFELVRLADGLDKVSGETIANVKANLSAAIGPPPIRPEEEEETNQPE